MRRYDWCLRLLVVCLAVCLPGLVDAASAPVGFDETMWTSRIWIILNYVMYLVLGLIAIYSVYHWIRGRKTAAFMGLGSFFLIMIFKELSIMLSGQMSSGFTALDAEVPVFGDGHPQLDHFAWIKGLMVGIMVQGAGLCANIITSTAYIVIACCFVLIFGLRVAYKFSKDQDAQPSTWLLPLCMLILLTAFGFLRSVRYNADPWQTPTTDNEEQAKKSKDRAQEMLDGSPTTGWSQAVPLGAAFVLEAAKGMSEEFATALFGGHSSDHILKATRTLSGHEAVQSSAISTPGTDLYIKYATLCMAASKRMMSIQTSGGQRPTDQGATNVPVTNLVTTWPSGYILASQIAQMRTNSRVVDSSEWSKITMLSPTYLTVGQYVDATGSILIPGLEHQYESYITKWAEFNKGDRDMPTKVPTEDWRSQAFFAGSPQIGWNPGTLLSKGVLELDGEAITVHAENVADTGIVSSLEAWTSSEAWSNVPDPFHLRSMGIGSSNQSRMACYVNYAPVDLGKMSWSEKTGVHISTWFSTDGVAVGNIDSDFTDTIGARSAYKHVNHINGTIDSRIKGQSDVGNVIPYVQTWSLPGIDQASSLSGGGEVFNYDLSLAAAAAIWKDYNATTCKTAEEDGPKNRHFFGCYLLNVNDFRSNVPENWRLHEIPAAEWTAHRLALYDLWGGDEGARTNELFRGNSQAPGAKPDLNNNECDIFAYFNGRGDTTARGSDATPSFDNLPRVRTFAAFMTLTEESQGQINQRVDTAVVSTDAGGPGWVEKLWQTATPPGAVIEVVYWLIQAAVWVVGFLFGTVVAYACSFMLILFPVVPIACLWRGDAQPALSWVKTTLWVYSWIPFFILGTIILAGSTSLVGTDGLSGGDFAAAYLMNKVGAIVGMLAGISVMVASPGMSRVIFEFSNSAFDKVAMVSYNSMMKVVGAGATITAMAATGSVGAGMAVGSVLGGGMRGMGMASMAMAKGGGVKAATGEVLANTKDGLAKGARHLGATPRNAVTAARNAHLVTSGIQEMARDGGSFTAGAERLMQGGAGTLGAVTTRSGEMIGGVGETLGGVPGGRRLRDMGGLLKEVGGGAHDLAGHIGGHASAQHGDDATRARGLGTLSSRQIGSQVSQLASTILGKPGDDDVQPEEQGGPKDFMKRMQELSRAAANRARNPNIPEGEQKDSERLYNEIEGSLATRRGDTTAALSSAGNLTQLGNEQVMLSQMHLANDNMPDAMNLQYGAASTYESAARIAYDAGNNDLGDEYAAKAIGSYSIARDNMIDQSADDNAFTIAAATAGMERMHIAQGHKGGQMDDMAQKTASAGTPFSERNSAAVGAILRAYEMAQSGNNPDPEEVAGVVDQLKGAGLSQTANLLETNERFSVSQIEAAMSNERSRAALAWREHPGRGSFPT